MLHCGSSSSRRQQQQHWRVHGEQHYCGVDAQLHTWLAATKQQQYNTIK
jgi:hypothetical protein